MSKNIRVNGNEVTIYSRHKKPWLAKLGGKSRQYGREREFVFLKRSVSGMRKQIVTYSAGDLEPGEYECAGDEFGPFRDTFTI